MNDTPAGARDRVVTIQQLTESTSSAGFPVESWTQLATVMMSRQPAGGGQRGGRERFTADQVAATVEDVWVTYYRADIDPEIVDVPKKRRLVMRGRVYDIVRADPRGFRKDIELWTRAASGVTP